MGRCFACSAVITRDEEAANDGMCGQCHEEDVVQCMGLEVDEMGQPVFYEEGDHDER